MNKKNRTVEKMKTHYAKGLNAFNISQKMGLPTSAVRHALKKEGVWKKMYPQAVYTDKERTARREEIAHLYLDEGWPIQDIANKFGVAEPAVYNHLKQYRYLNAVNI